MTPSQNPVDAALLQAAGLVAERLLGRVDAQPRMLAAGEVAGLSLGEGAAWSAQVEGAVVGRLTLAVPGAAAEGAELGSALSEAAHAMALLLGPLAPGAPRPADAASLAATADDTTRAAAVFAGETLQVVLLLAERVDSSAGPVVQTPAAFRPLAEPAPPAEVDLRRLQLLRDVEMGITVELGRTRMRVRDVLSLAPGVVLELDRAAGSPVDVLVNGTLIARGEVVVVDEEYAVRVTEVVSPELESRLGV